MTTYINPGPPAKANDPRFDQWQQQFWDWVQTNITGGGSSTDIIAGQVFGNRETPGAAPGIYEPDAIDLNAKKAFLPHPGANQQRPDDSQSIEAVQIFSRHPQNTVLDPADSQIVLAGQIFGS